MKTNVWVLTREENLYDQYGEYFVKVFGHAPTLKELSKVLKKDGDCLEDQTPSRQRLLHIKRGGGRLESESTWYHLRKHRVSTKQTTKGTTK